MAKIVIMDIMDTMDVEQVASQHGHGHGQGRACADVILCQPQTLAVSERGYAGFTDIKGRHRHPNGRTPSALS